MHDVGASTEIRYVPLAPKSVCVPFTDVPATSEATWSTFVPLFSNTNVAGVVSAGWHERLYVKVNGPFVMNQPVVEVPEPEYWKITVGVVEFVVPPPLVPVFGEEPLRPKNKLTAITARIVTTIVTNHFWSIRRGLMSRGGLARWSEYLIWGFDLSPPDSRYSSASLIAPRNRHSWRSCHCSSQDPRSRRSQRQLAPSKRMSGPGRRCRQVHGPLSTARRSAEGLRILHKPARRRLTSACTSADDRHLAGTGWNRSPALVVAFADPQSLTATRGGFGHGLLSGRVRATSGPSLRTLFTLVDTSKPVSVPAGEARSRDLSVTLSRGPGSSHSSKSSRSITTGIRS